MIDQLAEHIAKLAIRLGEIPPHSLEYEIVSTELADWLRVFFDLGLDTAQA